MATEITNMKYTWTPEDIKCGRIVCKPTEKKEFSPCGWSIKWTYKIGFLGGGNPLKRDAKGGDREDYCLVCMGDGMIQLPKSKKAIAKILNEEGMIPMPHDWLLKTFTYMRDAFD